MLQGSGVSKHAFKPLHYSWGLFYRFTSGQGFAWQLLSWPKPLKQKRGRSSFSLLLHLVLSAVLGPLYRTLFLNVITTFWRDPGWTIPAEVGKCMIYWVWFTWKHGMQGYPRLRGPPPLLGGGWTPSAKTHNKTQPNAVIFFSSCRSAVRLHAVRAESCVWFLSQIHAYHWRVTTGLYKFCVSIVVQGDSQWMPCHIACQSQAHLVLTAQINKDQWVITQV